MSFAVTLLSYMHNVGFLMTRLICIFTEAVTCRGLRVAVV